ncbi:conserved hypothetical protein [Clostridium botulinum A2 str. Kyoto]|uniref:Uncharacterized protein n=1 Tax=Clostridium botulinum (strain Kyoto / Type A2) TaxID=536232 RepID=C1FQL3_CLOBJ|nr:conserved hypothetical protein [Clostridium botulinum A2 str. Kyoto]
MVLSLNWYNYSFKFEFMAFNIFFILQLCEGKLLYILYFMYLLLSFMPAL